MLRHFPLRSARTSHPTGLRMGNIHLDLQLLLFKPSLSSGARG